MERQTKLTEWGFKNPLTTEEIKQLDKTICTRVSFKISNDWDFM